MRQKLSGFLTAGLLLAMVGSIPAGAGDWPGWRGPNRDGKSTDTGLLKAWPADGPERLWAATDLGKGYSSVAVVKDIVYTTGDVGEDLMIYALDGKGQIKWKAVQGPAFTSSYGGSRSTPVVDGDRLYLVGGDGLVTCHKTADGSLVWKRALKDFGGKPGRWGYSESVLIVDNMAVVTPGGRSALVALDKATGADLWKSDAEGKAHYSSPIVIGEKGADLIVQGTGSGLIAVNAKDGKKVWSDGFCADNTANCPDPAYADGYLFWANGYGKGGICFKVDFKDGAWTFKQAWQTKDMVCHHGGYVIDKGFIYGNHNAGWSCLDLKTGAPKWYQAGIGKGSVVFADGMLYLFGEKGGQLGLAAASPDGFTLSGQSKVAGSGTSWAHPAVANGRLYVRYDTNLYCFNVAAK
jgi:hypothetical protein